MKITEIEEAARRYEWFLKRVSIRGECWIYKHIVPQGYGSMLINGKNVRAHRYSYEVHKGKIPDGLVIDHLCCTKACVNPDHLEAVPQRVNMERGTIWIELRRKVLPTILPLIRAAQRKRIEIQRAKTHCARGHEYTPENTMIRKPTGTRGPCRRCRECKRFDSRVRMRRIRAERKSEVEQKSGMVEA